jgi:hypothetical protein
MPAADIWNAYQQLRSTMGGGNNSWFPGNGYGLDDDRGQVTQAKGRGPRSASPGATTAGAKRGRGKQSSNAGKASQEWLPVLLLSYVLGDAPFAVPKNSQIATVKGNNYFTQLPSARLNARVLLWCGLWGIVFGICMALTGTEDNAQTNQTPEPSENDPGGTFVNFVKSHVWSWSNVQPGDSSANNAIRNCMQTGLAALQLLQTTGLAILSTIFVAVIGFAEHFPMPTKAFTTAHAVYELHQGNMPGVIRLWNNETLHLPPFHAIHAQRSGSDSLCRDFRREIGIDNHDFTIFDMFRAPGHQKTLKQRMDSIRDRDSSHFLQCKNDNNSETLKEESGVIWKTCDKPETSALKIFNKSTQIEHCNPARSTQFFNNLEKTCQGENTVGHDQAWPELKHEVISACEDKDNEGKDNAEQCIGCTWERYNVKVWCQQWTNASKQENTWHERWFRPYCGDQLCSEKSKAHCAFKQCTMDLQDLAAKEYKQSYWVQIQTWLFRHSEEHYSRIQQLQIPQLPTKPVECSQYKLLLSVTVFVWVVVLFSLFTPMWWTQFHGPSQTFSLHSIFIVLFMSDLLFRLCTMDCGSAPV